MRWTKDNEELLRSIWGSRVVERMKRMSADDATGPPPLIDKPDSEVTPTDAPAARPPPFPPAATEETPAPVINADDLVGQEQAKASVAEVIAIARVNQARAARGLAEVKVNLHAMFVGAPGTGKTTFARYYAQEIRKLGLLSQGHLVEVTRRDLVAEYSGQTAPKTAAVIESAIGGVLFVDEAYALKRKDDSFGQECVDALITGIENHRHDLVVILAGYEDEMREFAHENPGLASRIPNRVRFADFTDDQLGEILDRFLERAEMQLSSQNRAFAVELISRKRKGRSFGNAREVRNLFERALTQQSVRLSKHDLTSLTESTFTTLLRSDLTPERDDVGDDVSATAEQHSPMADLNALIGLGAVKQEVAQWVDFITVSRARAPGEGLANLNLHMVFSGNPGTGKTTVARLLGSTFRDLGLLGTGHVVEVDRSELVAGYVGQTAIKTKERIQEAFGGILFIDEAYTLARGGDAFGQEAIDTLLKIMEDERDRLVVILAGYPLEMAFFLRTNPGLSSRFGVQLEFDDYASDELLGIARLLVESKGYHLTDEAATQLAARLEEERSLGSRFGNGRAVRNHLEAAYKRQARRLVGLGSLEDQAPATLNTLIASDFVDEAVVPIENEKIGGEESDNIEGSINPSDSGEAGSA